MKKQILAILCLLVLSGHLLSAAPSFSAVVAGNVGVEFDNSNEKEWEIPISAFAAVQFDFAEKFTLRGEMDFSSNDNSLSAFDGNEIFEATGGDTSIRLHELSFVYTKRAINSTHFLSAFLGSYEPIGTDTFLMRQFGCDSISSHLTKSFSNIAGVPLHYNSGVGISYISRLEKAPLSLGGYLYYFKNDAFSKSDSSGTPSPNTINLDFRLATSLPLITMDFGFGFGFPLQGFEAGDDEYSISIRIKDIIFNCGMNMLLGNKYGHGLLLQFGLNNLLLGKGSSSLNSGLTFLIESRLRFRTFKLNFAVYSLEEKNVVKTFYLADPIGAGITVEFDSIATKVANIATGFHLVASIEKELKDFSLDFNEKDLNFYISPFVEIPLSSSMSLDVMGQLGILKPLKGNDFNFNVKAMAGFKKQF
ncbi:MAG: hypothetical protein HDR35_07450 [Treponema sp.]|nr:hypothetical protein [Treponema sp.]